MSKEALLSIAGAARVPRAAPNIAFAEYRLAGAAMCLSPRRRPVAPALISFSCVHSDFPGTSRRRLACRLGERFPAGHKHHGVYAGDCDSGEERNPSRTACRDGGEH